MTSMISGKKVWNKHSECRENEHLPSSNMLKIKLSVASVFQTNFTEVYHSYPTRFIEAVIRKCKPTTLLKRDTSKSVILWNLLNF